MDHTSHSPRLRLFVALARIEESADLLADIAFALEQEDLDDEHRLLRDYCARLSMNLQDSFERLRALTSKAM